MKKLYNEFFYVPKYGEVKEKVMLMRTARTVMIMVVCLFAMSFMAYAYFSHNVTSGSNTIKAAHFEAQITVSSATDVVSLTTEGKYQVAALKAGKEYSVTLAAPTEDGSAETGFCVITDRYQSKIYHTQQLGVDEAVEGGKTPSITFTLTVNEDVDVFFLSHWGTSSSYDPYKTNLSSDELYVCGGDKVEIVVINSTGDVNNTKGEDDEAFGETTYQETPTEVVYTVQSGDTLSGIAKQYSTTVEKLVAYNGISNPNEIVIGQKIIIPPADYVIPETTPPETATTPETTTPLETTPSETTGTTETQTTPEPSTSTESTDSEETTGTTSEQETQPAEETTGAPDTEETGGTI